MSGTRPTYMEGEQREREREREGRRRRCPPPYRTGVGIQCLETTLPKVTEA